MKTQNLSIKTKERNDRFAPQFNMAVHIKTTRNGNAATNAS